MKLIKLLQRIATTFLSFYFLSEKKSLILMTPHSKKRINLLLSTLTLYLKYKLKVVLYLLDGNQTLLFLVIPFLMDPVLLIF